MLDRMRHAVAAVGLCSWLLAGPSLGAAPSPAPPTPGCATAADCFARVAALQRQVRAIRADFRQTKRIALLEEPLLSTGRLDYRAPDRIRWEVSTPEPLVVEIDATGMRAGEPGKVAKIEEPGASAVFKDLGSIFTASGDYAGTRFAIEAGDGPGSFRLVPREPGLARVIAAVDLTVDPATGVPWRAVLNETNGDRTEIDLDVHEIERGEPEAAR
jgi:outer membrane lipoprotein carrier protein